MQWIRMVKIVTQEFFYAGLWVFIWVKVPKSIKLNHFLQNFFGDSTFRINFSKWKWNWNNYFLAQRDRPQAWWTITFYLKGIPLFFFPWQPFKNLKVSFYEWQFVSSSLSQQREQDSSNNSHQDYIWL